MAAVNFRQGMPAAEFKANLGVSRWVPAKAADLHVHSTLTLRPSNPETMCGCGACELFDCYHGILMRRQLNQNRQLDDGTQVGKYRKVIEPRKYDSGRKFGEGTDITVLGPQIVAQLDTYRNDPSNAAPVVQDRSTQRTTINIAQTQQTRRNDTANEGLRDAIERVNANRKPPIRYLAFPRQKKAVPSGRPWLLRTTRRTA